MQQEITCPLITVGSDTSFMKLSNPEVLAQIPLACIISLLIDSQTLGNIKNPCNAAWILNENY